MSNLLSFALGMILGGLGKSLLWVLVVIWIFFMKINYEMIYDNQAGLLPNDRLAKTIRVLVILSGPIFIPLCCFAFSNPQIFFPFLVRILEPVYSACVWIKKKFGKEE